MIKILGIITVFTLWACSNHQLKPAEYEYKYTVTELQRQAQLSGDSLYAARAQAHQTQWEKVHKGGENPLRTLRAELWFSRIAIENSATQQQIAALTAQVATQQQLQEELENALQHYPEYAAQYAPVKPAPITEMQVKRATFSAAWQWEMLSLDWSGATVWNDSAQRELQHWQSAVQQHLTLQAQQTALQQNLENLQAWYNRQAQQVQKSATQKIAALGDSLFLQKRVWQEKYEDLLQKSLDKEFLKDQLSLTLQELRGVSHTALEKLQNCNQNLQNLAEKTSQAYDSFLGVVALGLRGVNFEEGRFVLSADRTEMLDKSLEMLQAFWPQTQIDAVHWADTNEFAVDSTLVANVVKKRHAYLQSRWLQNNPADSTAPRVTVRGCVRHNQQAVLDSAVSDSVTWRQLREYGDLSLVVWGEGLPGVLSMDSAAVCTPAELALLERGALPTALPDSATIAE